MNVALILGRGGSKSVVGKNMKPVLGRPLAWYPIYAARSAEKIGMVSISTDCPDLIQMAYNLGIAVIKRPPELSRDDSQMLDAITHALDHIDKSGLSDPEFLVTMHANCGTHQHGIIDAAISKLEDNPNVDSCVSVSVDKSVHPFRTRRLDGGYLEPWQDIPTGTSSNRQSLDSCAILDGACRAMRVKSCFPVHGDAPFPYLGKQIIAIDNGGFDVHNEDDLYLTEQWLKRIGWGPHPAYTDYHDIKGN